MGPVTKKALDAVEDPRSYSTACLSSQHLSSIPDYVIHNCKLTSLNLNYNCLEFLPDELFNNLQQLTFISLSGNSISVLPSNISNLTQLKELYANENEMQSLPTAICNLRNLIKLHLIANRIAEVPTSIGNMENLTELIIDENHVRELPESFGSLKKLERFEASFNCINSLPESFGELFQLKFLDLSNNYLTELPDSFSNLSLLVELDLSDNKLTELPEAFQSAYLLQKFYIDNNHLFSIPTWFGDMKNILHLSMKGNCIKKSFPENFGRICKKLKHVDLSGNYVDTLPESFAELENLQFLDMGSTFDEVERIRRLQNGNFLSSLPLKFGNLCNLHHLYLDENSLESLPESFGELVNLEYLDLSHNNLSSLPSSFSRLKALEVCLLSINYIQYLPIDFGELQNLKELRLDDNQLSSLPSSFCKLKKLETLDLFRNVMVEFPVALKFLTKLTHLDLNENEFEIPWEELENSNIQIIQNEEHNILGANGTEISEDNEEGLKLMKEQLNRIRKALKEGAEIWRRHREENEGKLPRLEFEAEKCWDSYLENNDVEDKNTKFENDNSDIFQNDDSSDDWEDRNVGRGQYKFGDPLEITPQDQFLPADIHPPPIQRVKINFIVEYGQFDDA